MVGATLFTVSAKGDLYAFNAAGKGAQPAVIDGRSITEEGGGTAVFSSLALAGKNLFLNTNTGNLIVLEATHDAKQLGKMTLSAGASSAPIFSGKHMFVRDGDKLLCIGE